MMQESPAQEGTGPLGEGGHAGMRWACYARFELCGRVDLLLCLTLTLCRRCHTGAAAAACAAAIGVVGAGAQGAGGGGAGVRERGARPGDE